MKTQDHTILTLEEVAAYTRYDLKYLNNNYMKLLAGNGVRVLRLAPNARPRFYKEDIEKLLERAK